MTTAESWFKNDYVICFHDGTSAKYERCSMTIREGVVELWPRESLDTMYYFPLTTISSIKRTARKD